MRSHPLPGPEPAPCLFVHRIDPRARLPTRANDYAIGWDVYAFLLTESGRAVSRALHQRGVVEIPTGISVQPSPGYYIEVHSRSIWGKRSVMVASGIIDPDYSGPLSIMLYNGSFETHYVAHEHRIAQLILRPIARCRVVEQGDPGPPIGRGTVGFGTTGL